MINNTFYTHHNVIFVKNIKERHFYPQSAYWHKLNIMGAMLIISVWPVIHERIQTYIYTYIILLI